MDFLGPSLNERGPSTYFRKCFGVVIIVIPLSKKFSGIGLSSAANYTIWRNVWIGKQLFLNHFLQGGEYQRSLFFFNDCFPCLYVGSYRHFITNMSIL